MDCELLERRSSFLHAYWKYIRCRSNNVGRSKTAISDGNLDYQPVQAGTNEALQSTNQSTIANGRHLPATAQQIYCFEWVVIFKFRCLLIALKSATCYVVVPLANYFLLLLR